MARKNILGQAGFTFFSINHAKGISMSQLMNKKPKPSIGSLRRLAEFEAHHRLLVSALIAAGTFAATHARLSFSVSLISSWNAFAVSFLILCWLSMFFTDAKTRVQEAHLQDSHRWTIFVCVVIASFAGLAGACFLLGSAKSMGGAEAIRHVLLAALTVISSWLLVHTMLALHYTHLFYCTCEDAGNSPSGSGVSFPQEDEPDFLDFAYFSFVIGMTFQVSDVEVTSRPMRRTVLLHGLLSFAFNTVIVAFSINLAATLL